MIELYSLPVPKQFVMTLREYFPFAQAANGGTWQPARSCIPMFLLFHYPEKVLTQPLFG